MSPRCVNICSSVIIITILTDPGTIKLVDVSFPGKILKALITSYLGNNAKATSYMTLSTQSLCLLFLFLEFIQRSDEIVENRGLATMPDQIGYDLFKFEVG
jgi:hypothetical protein